MQKILLEKAAGIGPCMDIRTRGDLLYVIQNRNGHPDGRLCVLTPQMKLIAEYTGLGNARQIEISGDTAIVTAREDGLWIFDIAQPQPRLVSHYKTLEFATGAAIYANFALVSCRQFGVEIIDISEPAAPRHAGIIRIGEVQSACVADGILYGGIWGAMAVAVVDIRDIEHPRLICRIPLEGRGDGVFVRGGILYAVTGQHRRGLKNTVDPADPCYGVGNGLSVFDIHDPEHPRELHREYFGKCYNISMDTWKPALCGNTVVCCCSTLGVFAYDKDTYVPLFHAQLPQCAALTDMTLPIMDAVTGFAALGRTLYVCGGRSDLYACVTETELGECSRWDTAERFPVPAHALRTEKEDGITLRPLYRPEDGAPVLDLCECGIGFAAACAEGGLRLLDENFTELDILPTETFCCDVEYAGGILAAALSDGGIWLGRAENNALHTITILPTTPAALQLRLTADGRTMLCACGAGQLRLYDLSDAAHPRLMETREGMLGPLYGDNFTRGDLGGGRLVGFGHRTGLLLADPSAEPKLRTIFYKKHNGFMGFGPESGCDTDGKRIFLTMDGGYVFLPMGEVYADDLPVYRPQTPICGKIALCGDYLAAAERAEGIVSVTDIRDPEHPKTVGSLHTNASPGKPLCLRGRMLLPAAHGGLLEILVK